MKALYSLFLVFALAAFALLGAGTLGMEKAFGLYIPFLAVAVFVVGFCLRVVDWGKSAVPFCIPRPVVSRSLCRGSNKARLKILRPPVV